MQLHHLGIACNDIASGIAECGRFYDVADVGAVVWDPLQQAELCLLATRNGVLLELVAGPAVQAFRRRGVALYHVCYEVENLTETIARFEGEGALVVSEARPAVLFDGRHVAFLQTPQGLVELLAAR